MNEKRWILLKKWMIKDEYYQRNEWKKMNTAKEMNEKIWILLKNEWKKINIANEMNGKRWILVNKWMSIARAPALLFCPLFNVWQKDLVLKTMLRNNCCCYCVPAEYL